MRVLIAIPTKTAPEYIERASTCEATWLKDYGVDYGFFRDTSLNGYDFRSVDHTWYCGLDGDDPQVRQKRMKAMCRHALLLGYDYIFRVDSDAYVRIDRLLASGFEQHDYMGWHKVHDISAFGSVGFFLSRRAMQLIVDAKHFPHPTGNLGLIYWGDIWVGQVLQAAGIECHVHAGFVDGLGTDFTSSNLPDGNWISVHPVSNEEMVKIHEAGR